MKTRTVLVATMTVFVLCITTATIAEQIRVIGFNIEAGWLPDGKYESDLITIANQMSRISTTKPTVDLWGLSEVTSSRWPENLTKAVGDNFKMVLGNKNEALVESDHLLAIYNADKFTLIRSEELEYLRFGKGRAPLVLHLKMNRPDSTELLFMVNHLHRGSEHKRHKQSMGLNKWAKKQKLPIIAVGDYNFDWKLPQEKKDWDKGYDLMTADGVFEWVRPKTLVKTQCSEKYNSVLDFAFVANGAKKWPSQSRILVSDGDCPDTLMTSDHRPVELMINIP